MKRKKGKGKRQRQRRRKRRRKRRRRRRQRTFNAVRLNKLTAINKKGLRNGIPSHAPGKAEVDMGGGKLVHVEPDIFFPPVFDESLVWLEGQVLVVKSEE